MRANIVLAHPERQSFNGRLADISRERLVAGGWDVSMSDLYGDGFDPREGPDHYDERADAARFHAQTEQRHNADSGTTPPDVAAEVDKLLQSDLLVVHFPLWWFGMPAMLKGWMDRVFVYGTMYRSQMRYDAGRCVGKKALVCVTTGASADSCAHDGRESDTRMLLWPILFPFRYIGFDVMVPQIFHGIGGVASMEHDEEGLSDLDRYQQTWAHTLDTVADRPLVPFNADTDFDDSKRLIAGAPVHSPFIAHEPNPLWP